MRKENDSLEIKIETCEVRYTITIASGYAGHDPQGGTSDESFFANSLLSYKKWLKFSF